MGLACRELASNLLDIHTVLLCCGGDCGAMGCGAWLEKGGAAEVLTSAVDVDALRRVLPPDVESAQVAVLLVLRALLHAVVIKWFTI